jgi:iron complex transport system substrate-binding protein
MLRRITFPLIALLLLLSVVAGCGGAAPKTTTPAPTTPAAEQKPAEAAKSKQTTYPITVKDDLGREVTIPAEPKRIVSVAPSNTELLFALGKGGVLVGRSDFDDFPAEVANVPSIGGWMPPSYEKIIAAKPDLMLLIGGSDEARNKLIDEYKLNVFVLDPQTFEQAYDGIKRLGVAINAQDAADKLVADMQAAVKEVTDKVAKATTKPKVYYEVWDEPLMTVGAGTYIDDMIRIAGGVNVAADSKGWATINAEVIAKANPDIIIASSADIETKIKARPTWAEFKAIKDGKVVVVGDANHVSRPGPRLVLGLQWFAKTIHPELFK